METLIKKYYNKHKETIHNFIWRSLQILGKQGVTFLIFILCAKILTPYDFGIYNYALAIIFFLIMFGDFGVSTATSKYVAEYNATNKDKLKSVLFNSGIIILGLTVIITILTLIMGPWYLKDKYVYILWLLPLIFLAPMTSLYDGIYRGLKQFKKLAIISLIIGIFSLSFVYILIKQYGLIGALISQAVFYLLLFLALAFGYREFNFKFNKELMKEVGKYSIIVGIAGLGYFLFSRISIIILGNYGYITEIGYFELINKVIMLIILPATIMGQVISPVITKLYYKNLKSEVFKKYKKYMFFSLVIGFLVALLTYFIFPILLKLFLSQYYLEEVINSMNILLILIISQFMAVLASVGFSTSSGHARFNMYWLLAFGVLNIILNIILINKFAFVGAIYSMLIIKLMSDITFILYYYKVLKNEAKK